MGENLETLGMMGEDVVKGLFEYSKYMLIYPTQFRRSVKSRGMGKMILNGGMFAVDALSYGALALGETAYRDIDLFDKTEFPHLPITSLVGLTTNIASGLYEWFESAKTRVYIGENMWKVFGKKI